MIRGMAGADLEQVLTVRIQILGLVRANPQTLGAEVDSLPKLW